MLSLSVWAFSLNRSRGSIVIRPRIVAPKKERSSQSRGARFEPQETLSRDHTRASVQRTGSLNPRAPTQRRLCPRRRRQTREGKEGSSNRRKQPEKRWRPPPARSRAASSRYAPAFEHPRGYRSKRRRFTGVGASRDPIPGAESPRASSPRKRTKIRPASFADHARTSRTRPLHAGPA